MDEVIISEDGWRRRRAFLTSAQFAHEEVVIVDEVREKLGQTWQVHNGVILSALDIEACRELIDSSQKALEEAHHG